MSHKRIIMTEELSLEQALYKYSRDVLRQRRIKTAKYLIDISGVASDSIGDILIDDIIILEQYHPNSTLFLHNKRNTKDITYSDACFYANILSYKTDCPNVVWPLGTELRKIKYRYVHSGRKKDEKYTIHKLGEKNKVDKKEIGILKKKDPYKVFQSNFYKQQVESIINTRESRHGPNTYVIADEFNWDKRNNFDFTKEYGGIKSAISLYANALKQIDFQSEYLNYYRIIEYFSQSNGKKCLENNIERIYSFNAQKINIFHNDTLKEEPIDLFKYYKRIGIKRLDLLIKEKGSIQQVVKYLYNTNRCGIAHGKDILDTSIDEKYFNIFNDTILLKLISRILIDDNITST